MTIPMQKGVHGIKDILKMFQIRYRSTRNTD